MREPRAGPSLVAFGSTGPQGWGGSQGQAEMQPVAQRTRPGSSEPEDTWKMSRRIKTVSGGLIQELYSLFFIACGIDQNFHINKLYIYNQTK